MSRYRRVNIDGKSLYKTETRITAAELLPGTAVTINGDGIRTFRSLVTALPAKRMYTRKTR
ncbi:hypothetical protein IFY18_002681 [Salmonella enterica]|nr:hypothetical protein [Salmonella enterica]